MSSGDRLPFAEAFRLAEQIAEALRPHVVRLKAVGSLRRRRPTVGDLEFVAEPRLVLSDLFGSEIPDTASIRHALEALGTWVKGGDRMMQITDVLGCEGLKCEVYLVHPPAEWGCILAIRTGPAALGAIAVTRMRARGLRHDDGRVVRAQSGLHVPTPEEADFFAAAGIPFVPPAERDALVEQLGAITLGVGR